MIDFTVFEIPSEFDVTTKSGLTELQHHWYEAACEQGLPYRISQMARALGKPLDERYGPKYAWRVGLPSVGQVLVYVDDYGNYTDVKLLDDDRTVMSTHYCSKRFIPGTWVAEILTYEADATAIHKAKQQRREQEEVNRLRLTLGLPEVA